MVKLIQESGSSHPKPCKSRENALEFLSVRLLVNLRRKKTDRGLRSAFPSENSPFALLILAHKIPAPPLAHERSISALCPRQICCSLTRYSLPQKRLCVLRCRTRFLTGVMPPVSKVLPFPGGHEVGAWERRTG